VLLAAVEVDTKALAFLALMVTVYNPEDEPKPRVYNKNNLLFARSLPFIIWYFLTFESNLILRIVVTIFHLTPCTLPKWLNRDSELLIISG
jgi:hypothetical protein